MSDLSEVYNVLNKKKSLKAKIISLSFFFKQNDFSFKLFCSSSVFSERFEIQDQTFIKKIDFQNLFGEETFKILSEKDLLYLNELDGFNFQKNGVCSIMYFFKKPVGFLYLNSKNESEEKLLNILQFLSYYFDGIIRQFHMESKLKNKTLTLQNKLLEIESIFNITELLNSYNTNSNDLYQDILLYVISTLNASKAIILLKNTKSSSYELIASIGIDSDELNKKMIRDTKGILNDLKNSKSSLIINNTDDFILSKFSELNCMASPILSQNILHGAIIAYDKESRDGSSMFDNFDLRLFDNITKKISLSFDNILLLESLTESKKSIDNIMSSISTGIIKIDVLGEIDYTNFSATKVFGFDKDLIIGNHYFIVFEGNVNLIKLIEKTELEKEIVFENNFEILDLNNKSHQINLTISPVFDENNENSGVVLSFEDLSGINKVKSTFKKYVSENIVDELLKNENSLELGGKEEEVCVMFADIRGFTSLSEKMDAPKVVYVLNNYFQSMIDVIFKYSGTLDKIIGDELMVLYGVPIKAENDCQNAVDSAISMLDSLKDFNKKMKIEGLPKLNIGIGINFGKVVSGNIGSKQQMNYTVIGDNVNLAARLCSSAKGGEISISKSVYENLKIKDGFTKREPIKVKGKEIPVDNWSIQN